MEKIQNNKDKDIKVIDIESLQNGIPVVTEGFFGIYKEACIVCFENEKHVSGVKLELLFDDDKKDICKIVYSGKLTKKLLKSHADNNKTTDNAAVAIALLLIREYTNFVAEQAANPIGNGVDFYLVDKNMEDYDEALIYNHSAVLEVSGIRTETRDNSVEKRLKDKLRRLEKYQHDFSMPTYVIIVEFSKPYARIYGASI